MAVICELREDFPPLLMQWNITWTAPLSFHILSEHSGLNVLQSSIYEFHLGRWNEKQSMYLVFEASDSTLLLEKPHADPVQSTPYHYNLCFLHLTLSTYLHHDSSGRNFLNTNVQLSKVCMDFMFSVIANYPRNHYHSLNFRYLIVVDFWVRTT